MRDNAAAPPLPPPPGGPSIGRHPTCPGLHGWMLSKIPKIQVLCVGELMGPWAARRRSGGLRAGIGVITGRGGAPTLRERRGGGAGMGERIWCAGMSHIKPPPTHLEGQGP